MPVLRTVLQQWRALALFGYRGSSPRRCFWMLHLQPRMRGIDGREGAIRMNDLEDPDVPEEFVYRIKDWNDNFENNRTRELLKLSWVPIPNSLDGAGYTELIEHQNGPAHYAVWVGCVIVASKCDPRGTLLRGSKKAHNLGSLSRISRIPQMVFEEALPRLIELGWLERIPISEINLQNEPQCGATIPQQDATKSQQGALNGKNGKKGIYTPKHDLAEVTSIYEAYPRKVARSEALTAIDKALSLVTADVLLAAVREYAASPAAKELKYVPYPATWFNNHRWEDDRSSWGSVPVPVEKFDAEAWRNTPWIP